MTNTASIAAAKTADKTYRINPEVMAYFIAEAHKATGLTLSPSKSMEFVKNRIEKESK